MKVEGAWVCWTPEPSIGNFPYYMRPRAFSSFLLSSLVPGTLQCNQWAGISILTCLLFLKTFLAHLEPILDMFIASPPVPEDFRNLWHMETYQKIYFKNRPILYCFRKTPSKFAFFCWKMAKNDLYFWSTFVEIYIKTKNSIKKIILTNGQYDHDHRFNVLFFGSLS